MSLWVVELVLAVLAACRVTHLITTDDITQPLRDRVARRGDHDLLWRLIRCPWCIGFWISAAAVTIAWHLAPCPGMPWWFAIPAEALAASHIVGTLANWTPDD